MFIFSPQTTNICDFLVVGWLRFASHLALGSHLDIICNSVFIFSCLPPFSISLIFFPSLLPSFTFLLAAVALSKLALGVIPDITRLPHLI